jgi:hypothetical protein
LAILWPKQKPISNEKSPTRQDIQEEQMNFAKKHPELFQQTPSALVV